MTFLLSAEFLLALLVHEAPVIDERPKLHDAWEKEVAMAVDLDVQVGRAGALISPEVDTAILDAMRWYEARLASRPKDGDCHSVPIFKQGQAPLYKTVCSAIGPLQVQLVAFKAVLGTPDAVAAGITAVLLKPTEQDLREPEMGVRAGYAGLLRWKGLCGGVTPARWITAWGWGKCPPPRTVDREGVRRCELVTLLLVSRGELPEGWKCGHEGRKIHDDHDQRFLKWAWDKAKAEREARVEAEEK
jgi:hypothetical protein